MVGVTVRVAGAVALAGVTASHAASSEAVTSSVPPPVLVTATVLAAGLVPPAVAVKASVVGETESAGGVGGLTVSVTVIVFGDPVAPVAVTVTSVVYVPAARPVIDGVTVIVPVFVPLAGDRLSHVALSAAVQSIDPPPVLLTDSVLAAGSEPPAVAVKARLPGVTDSAGGVGGSTVRVTGMVLGEPVAPEAVTVTSVGYVPAARPVIDGVTVIVPALVPLVGDSLSQAAPSEAVQSIDPPPVLLTASVLAAGLEPPSVAVKDRLAGDTVSVGGVAGSTVKVTGIVLGEPPAPLAVTVTSVV